MPFYASLKSVEPGRRARIVNGLKSLRAAFRSGPQAIPAKTANDTLLLATWNIREFDSGKYGWRDQECYHYIAEIIDRFDLVAIQEVRESLYALQRVRQLLGPSWDYLVTDVTLGRSGNSERMAFLYDRRKIEFTGLAAELVLPKEAGENDMPIQFARSPYISGFRAGWAYLTLVTVHIYYGESVAVDPRRLAEIENLGRTIARSAGGFSAANVYEPGGKPSRDNLILLGDFNIFNRADVTMEALTKAGFRVPDELQSIPGSNVGKDKHYDQIAYYKALQALKPTGRAGVFDPFECVFREADAALYDGDRAAKPGRSFRDWRTYRLSDHLPMWVEFSIDDSDAYLDRLAAMT